jgi:hypothetical protein
MTTQDKTMAAPHEIKNQMWRDDLRLPCLVNPADTAAIVAELDSLRKPPPPFQSKHLPALKRNKWFVLKRGRERRGLVVVWPQQQCCIYISGDAPGKRQGVRVALLRIRVDPTFLSEGAGLTVFAATLSAETRTLMFEDALIWKGRPVLSEEPFTKRWRLVVQWIEHYCILDARLLGGLDIRATTWEPLAALRPTGSWFIQSDDIGRGALVWSVHHKELIPSPPRRLLTASVEETIQAPTLEESGPLVAVATRDSGPEQWSLASSDGVSLGRALIRRLAVSQGLRSAKANVVRVLVEWASQFKKWEIIGTTDLSARHSAAFLTV